MPYCGAKQDVISILTQQIKRKTNPRNLVLPPTGGIRRGLTVLENKKGALIRYSILDIHYWLFYNFEQRYHIAAQSRTSFQF